MKKLDTINAPKSSGAVPGETRLMIPTVDPYGNAGVCALTKRKEMVERRKHNRFQVKDGASVVLRAHFLELGQIIDVSKGGLAFRYIPSHEPSSGASELVVLLDDRSFYLDGIPFKIISDFETNNDPFSFLKIRRCGLQFGKLTHNHVSQLEHFIRRYATKQA